MMMIRFTLIARQSDGLPLVATMESQQDEDAIASHKRMAKSLLRSLASSSASFNAIPTPTNLPTKGSITANDFNFHYLVESGVVFLVLCDRTYPRLLGFSFLAEISKAFFIEAVSSSASGSVSQIVQSAVRPYGFIKFEPFIQSTKKRYINTRQLRTQEDLVELSSRIQSIPVYRVDDVLGSDYNRISTISRSGSSFSSIDAIAASATSFSAALKDLSDPSGGSDNYPSLPSNSKKLSRRQRIRLWAVRLLANLAVVVFITDFLMGLGYFLGTQPGSWIGWLLGGTWNMHSLEQAFVVILTLLCPFVAAQAYVLRKSGTLSPLVASCSTLHGIVTIAFIVYLTLTARPPAQHPPLQLNILQATGTALTTAPATAAVSATTTATSNSVAEAAAPALPSSAAPTAGGSSSGVSTALSASVAGPTPTAPSDPAAPPVPPPPVPSQSSTSSPPPPPPATPQATTDSAAAVAGGTVPGSASSTWRAWLFYWAVTLGVKGAYLFLFFVMFGASTVRRWSGQRVKKGRSD